MIEFIKKFNLPSGSIFVNKTDDDSYIESTMMQDISMSKIDDVEVRNTLDPLIIWKHLIPIKDKLLLTVSTQKGCVHNCKFCDVAPLPFKGNLTTDEILEQLDIMLKCFPEYIYQKSNEIITNKAKLGFSREGEPAHNLDNVLNAIYKLKSLQKYSNINWLPCFNTILPRKCMNDYTGYHVIDKVLHMKEDWFDGYLHFQISCNSTDEEKRKELFGGADVLSLKEIIEYINKYPKISNRTITLNFIVMKDVPIDVMYLKELGLNPKRFAVKLIPMNRTDNSITNNLETLYDYSTYDKLKELSSQFASIGIPVVYDAVTKCENAGLCCGQLVNNFNKL